MYSLLQHLKFWILSRQCVTNCVWLPQQTRAVFLYNSHQLVFIKQTSRVFCEVGTQFSSFLQTSPYQVFWIIRDVPTFFIPTRQRSKFVGLPIGDLWKWNVQCRHFYRLYNSDTWIETPTSESSPTGSNLEIGSHIESLRNKKGWSGLPCRTECTKQIVVVCCQPGGFWPDVSLYCQVCCGHRNN